MRTSLLSILLLVLICTHPAAEAQSLRYAFTGTLNESLGDLPAGAPFEGSWTLSVPQTGVPFVEGPPGATSGRRYAYQEFSVRIADASFSQQARDLVFVSTTDLQGDPLLTSFWPSGFSSDFSVSSGDLFPSGDAPDTSFGAQVWRVAVVFNADGQTWNDFALPTDAAVLAAMDGGVRFSTLDAGDAFGGITGITITAVPLPPAWILTLAAVAAVATRRRIQR